MKKYFTQILVLLNLVMVLVNLFFGSVHIPAMDVLRILVGIMPDADISPSPAHFIVLGSRLPAALTAMLTGAALGVCGLLLQSYFRNPLAGPSILGITSGANLAVAIGALALGITSGFGMTIFAMAGAAAVLLILLGLNRFIHRPITMLIIGILLSYLTSALITLLGYYASADGLQLLMLWGIGTFHEVGTEGIKLYASVIIVALLMSGMLIRPLNGWMLGELYARNAGISLRKTRWLSLVVTGILCAITTAYCGPIAFVGLSMPHVARLFLQTDNHYRLLPASMLMGALCCSICLWISTLPDGGRTLPINALTPILGVPVIVYVLLKK